MRLKWKTGHGLTVQDKAKIEFALDMVSRSIDRLLYVMYKLFYYIYNIVYSHPWNWNNGKP